jgi:hypothetical protein
VRPAVTNDGGLVTFNLDYGVTYYVFCHLAGYTFSATSITPQAGTVAFTKDVGTAIVAGTSDNYADSFLSRTIASVRSVTDEPELNAKYTDSKIIELIEQNYALVLAEINRNSRTPVVVKTTVTYDGSTAQYRLPNNIGSVYAIYTESTAGTRLFYSSRDRLNTRGRFVWVEGQMLCVQPNVLASGTIVTVEWIPSGTARLHCGACGVSTDGLTVTLGASPYAGALDTHNNAYSGCVLRILKADGTNDYMQESPISSYDNTTRQATLAVALSPVPTAGEGSIYYEIAPSIHQGLDQVVAYAASMAIVSIEGNVKRLNSMRLEYLRYIRNLRLTAYYSNMQEASGTDRDNSGNSVPWRHHR